MHSHDPLRYLGDMLAWVHQSIATEKEIAVGLFGTGGPAASRASASNDGAVASSPSVPSSTPTATANATAATTASDEQSAQAAADDDDVDDYNGPSYMLDRIFDGVVRPLKVGRVDGRVGRSPLPSVAPPPHYTFIFCTMRGRCIGRSVSIKC